MFQRHVSRQSVGLAARRLGAGPAVRAEDLIEIIRKTEVERKRNFVEPAARDPWVRFFGRDATKIVHQSTGDEEDVFAF